MSEGAGADSQPFSSVLVEIFRKEAVDTAEGILRNGEGYLLVVGSQPAIKVFATISQREFFPQVRRINCPSAGGVEQALKELSNAVTLMLEPALSDLPAGPVQIDLVTNAAELQALPFELFYARNGYAVISKDKPIEVTRRIRSKFAYRASAWRAKPRFLFISGYRNGTELRTEAIPPRETVRL